MARRAWQLGAFWRRSLLLDFTLLALLSFPAWRLLLPPGYPGGHDAMFHLFRLVELDGAIRAGVYYPRLAANLALGYDYPVFNYYAPLSVYLAEMFKLAGLGYLDAVKPVFALSIVCGSWFMLLFSRDHLPRFAALVAALSYAFLPYMLVDVYVRGALAEAVALALLPLCLWAFGRLADRPSAGGIVRAGVSLAALVLAHNVTALLFSPLLAGYWLLSSARSWRQGAHIGLFRGALAAGAAVAFALALSAFYWLPALAERELVLSGRLLEGFFDYHNHFQSLGGNIQLSFAYDYSYDYSRSILFRMGLVQLCLSALGLVFGFFSNSAGHRPLSLFFGFALAGSLVLQVSQSSPVWEAIPLSAYVQFPWRLLAIIGLASSMLIGILATKLLALRPARLGLLANVTIVVLAAASTLPNLSSGRLALAEENLRPWTLQRIELEQKLIAMTTGEYLPRGASDPFGPAQTTTTPISDSRLDLTAREVGLFRLTADVEADKDGEVIFDRFYFPGWQAMVDGQPVTTYPLANSGLLAVAVPAGSHQLTVWFGDTRLRSSASVASALALLVLVTLTLWPLLRRLSLPTRSGQSQIRYPYLLILLCAATLLSLSMLVAAGQQRGLGAGDSRVALRNVAGSLDGGIRLAGATLDGFHSDTLGVTLYWQSRKQPAANYEVALRLLDSTGQIVGRRDKQPLFGMRPTSEWRPGQLVRDHQEIALDVGVPAGMYQLVVGLLDPGSAGSLIGGDAGQITWQEESGSGAGLTLGQVLMPERKIGAIAPLSGQSTARFGERIVLSAYGLQRIGADGGQLPLGKTAAYTATLGQGEGLRIQLNWKLLKDLDADYTVFAHLLDARQQMIAQGDSWLHPGFYPTSLWMPGQDVLEQYDIVVPANARPGRYDLTVGLYRRSDMRRLPLSPDQGGRDRLSLGTVKVFARPPLSADKLPVSRYLHAKLGGEANLIGHNLQLLGAQGQPNAAQLKPRDQLKLTSYWSAENPISQDYTIFAHLYGPEGKVAAQVDGPPVAGNYPTTAWEAGEVVVDERIIDLPAELAPAGYKLALGMYQLQSGQRLLLPSGDDLVILELINVGQ